MPPSLSPRPPRAAAAAAAAAGLKRDQVVFLLGAITVIGVYLETKSLPLEWL